MLGVDVLGKNQQAEDQQEYDLPGAEIGGSGTFPHFLSRGEGEGLFKCYMHLQEKIIKLRMRV